MNYLMNIFNSIPISFLSGSLFGGFFVWWLKHKITLIDKKKNVLAEKQREVFNNFLKLWQQRRSNLSDKFYDSLDEAANEFMIWCPDEVLYHFSFYLSNDSTQNAEVHFGKAILAFRKKLGYKNRWWKFKKLTPEKIVLIYNAGGNDKVS